MGFMCFAGINLKREKAPEEGNAAITAPTGERYAGGDSESGDPTHLAFVLPEGALHGTEK
jgi:hypothetical protein